MYHPSVIVSADPANHGIDMRASNLSLITDSV
jgi:hypothetical protein